MIPTLMNNSYSPMGGGFGQSPAGQMGQAGNPQMQSILQALQRNFQPPAAPTSLARVSGQGSTGTTTGAGGGGGFNPAQLLQFLPMLMSL